MVVVLLGGGGGKGLAHLCLGPTLIKKLDKDWKTALKSFPGRSLRKTWKVGELMFNDWEEASMMSKMLETTVSVLGPEEQPKSAILKHFGNTLSQYTLMLSSSIGLTIDITSLYYIF
ncbi:hypothetical protein G4B88_023950, partial [Cannabis sativa]